MKVLVVGLGSAGRRHLRNLHAIGIRKLSAFRVRGWDAEEVSRLGVKTYTDLNAALDQEPDAVVIANPTSAHVAVAMEAAKRGCHLLIEKPLSHDLAGVDDLIRVVRSGRLVAAVGCNFRFHPTLRRVRTIAQEHELGRVITVRAHLGEYLPDWHPGEDWKASYAARHDLGGGVVLTQSHELDYLCWMFGEARSVFMMAGAWSGLGIDIDDVAEMLVTFSNEVHASVHLDYVQRPPTRSLEMVAERGTIRWDFGTGRLSVYDAGRGSWEQSDGPGHDQRNEMYVAEVQHFVECIRGNESPLVPLEEGRRVLEIIEAAGKSNASGSLVRLGSDREQARA